MINLYKKDKIDYKHKKLEYPPIKYKTLSILTLVNYLN